MKSLISDPFITTVVLGILWPLIQAACYQHGGSWNVLPLRLHYGINRQVRHGLMRLQNLGIGSHPIFRRIRMYLL